MLRTLIVPCFVAAIAWAWAEQAQAAVRLDAAQIKAGLRTAAPEEEGFVERVVTMANEGKLPLSLVDSTFQWARKKPEHKFQYFKRGLIVRAAKIGIAIPG
jgi:tRNA(Ile)-lysidine synthase TilS/MesJ